MNKEKVIKFLIPLVAVVVIIESVVLVSGSLRKESTEMLVADGQVEESKSVEMKLVADKSELVVGEKLSVDLMVVADKDLAVDAFDAYIKYDPQLVDVSGLVFGDGLPKPLSKISREKGLVVVTYLIDEPAGYQMVPGVELNLAKFVVTAKKAGLVDLEIATSPSSEGSVSMVVESANSEVMPLAVSGLKINVLNN